MPAELYDPIKYPVLAQDFFDDGEVVVHTAPLYEHVSATPEECKPCAEKEERIAELEKEIADFKKKHNYYPKSKPTYNKYNNYPSYAPPKH